jgi:hypothetical protein
MFTEWVETSSTFPLPHSGIGDPFIFSTGTYMYGNIHVWGTCIASLLDLTQLTAQHLSHGKTSLNIGWRLKGDSSGFIVEKLMPLQLSAGTLVPYISGPWVVLRKEDVMHMNSLKNKGSWEWITFLSPPLPDPRGDRHWRLAREKPLMKWAAGLDCHLCALCVLKGVGRDRWSEAKAGWKAGWKGGGEGRCTLCLCA